MTWKLEKALANVPYDHFDISEEVQEQVRIKAICGNLILVVIGLVVFVVYRFIVVRLN